MDGMFCFSYIMFMAECTGDDVDYVSGVDGGLAYSRILCIGVGVLNDFPVFIVVVVLNR